MPRKILVLMLMLLLMACGSDDDTTDGDLTDGDATDGDMTDGDTTDGDITDGDIGETWTIRIADFEFDPASLTIQPGDTVVWVNEDSAPHTATSGDPDGGPDGSFDSGNLNQGESFSFTFTSAGNFPYYCTIHPAMLGEIVVEATTDGDMTDGDMTDGDMTDGDMTDGDVSDGDMTDGDMTDGDMTDGDMTDGDMTDGDMTDGDMAETFYITIDNFSFDPASLNIQAGDTVVWTNEDSVAHTVTSGDPDGEGPDMIFDSGTMATGDSFSFTFNSAGDFAYYCRFHPSMKGNIEVMANDAETVCLRLSEATLSAVGSDGVWSPGEAATITVTMTNICEESFNAYPGVTLESQTEGFEVTAGIANFYAILPDQPLEAVFTVEAGNNLMAGTTGAFIASVFALGCEDEWHEGCPNPAPYYFEFNLEAPVTAQNDCLGFSDFALRHYIAEPATNWEPGVRVAAEVQMINNCDEGIWTYPAAKLSADNPNVAIVQPLNLLYGIGPGGSTHMAWEVTAGVGMSAGTVVTFTVIATTLNCDGDNPPDDCPAPNAATMTKAIGSDLDPRE